MEDACTRFWLNATPGLCRRDRGNGSPTLVAACLAPSTALLVCKTLNTRKFAQERATSQCLVGIRLAVAAIEERLGQVLVLP